MSNKIFIIGATGLIGEQLVKSLLENKYNPVVLARNPSKAKELFNNRVEVEPWKSDDIDGLSLLINGSGGVVNLAGESIATRWTNRKKVSILKSRVDTTNTIASAINKCSNPPSVFVQASAIGYYPHNSRIQFDEGGTHGEGFLSQVVMQWEQAAISIESKSRLVVIRTGVVLSNEGGFLKKILLPIKLFAGGWFGDGSQILSWIHISDHVRAIQFLIGNESCKGIYNLVSPEPIPYKLFVKRIGSILKRPVWLTTPAFILKMIFGKMANEVVLSNQNVIPERLIHAGFKFGFSSIDDALIDLLKGKNCAS